jgi:DNA-binding winged helix-turn-helix (wHTH) protein
VLDPVRGEVIAADGSRTVLRAKTLALLNLLLEHAGQLLSQNEILDRLWPDVTVAPASVTQCISELRQALGAADSEKLKTMPRRGYVLEVVPELEAAGSQALSVPARPAMGAFGPTALPQNQGRAPDLTAPIAVDAPAEGRTAAWCVERPLTLPTDPEPMQLFILPNLDSQPSIFQELLAEMRDPNNPANTVQRDLVGARLLRMVGGAPVAEPPRSVYLTSPTPAVYPASYGVQQLDR